MKILNDNKLRTFQGNEDDDEESENEEELPEESRV